ncbi:MAG: FMN-binding protein [Ruminococcus flavefaciens]|nr:FMN-binding protein [Ruminococcus flavefaciens]
MKKEQMIKAAVALALAVLVTGVLMFFTNRPAPEPADSVGDGSYTPGTCTGEGQGFGGTVTVEITTTATAITDVKVTGDSETPEIGGAALEELAGQVKAAQSADIDGVSGATLTSNGVREAAASAIAQAEG